MNRRRKRRSAVRGEAAAGVTQGLFALLALLCTALAVAGVILPGLPTTPFLLLAAWAAKRGCPPLDRWLHRHPRLGPALQCWETQRAIPTRAKWFAVVMMGASWVVMAGKAEGTLWPLATALLFVGVGTYVLTRPTPQPIAADEDNPSVLESR